jgi:hypothetical protein
MNSYPKQMITMLLANAKQNQIKGRTQKKGILSRLPKSPSSPRTPIQIGERQFTPTIAWWKSHGYTTTFLEAMVCTPLRVSKVTLAVPLLPEKRCATVSTAAPSNKSTPVPYMLPTTTRTTPS